MSHVKLALGIPNVGFWHTDFGTSFAAMCVFMSNNGFEEGQTRDVVLIERRTSMLPRARQEIVEDSINQNATHLLFLDTDQTFPADTAHRLLRWKKPVVAANIALKMTPSFPNARARGPTDFGIPVTSHGTKSGLEKIWRVGSGIMLVDLAIMKDIPKPWFEIRYNHKCATHMGEDWYFCEAVERAGYDIFIDHDLSRQVGHIGQYCFTHANIPNVEDAVAA